MSGALALWANNSRFIGNETKQASITVADRGLMLSDGIFETLPILQGRAVWWDEHMTRMRKAAQKLDLPFDQTEIKAALNSLLSGLGKSATNPMILRITLTRGAGGRGLLPPDTANTQPNLILALSPFPGGMAFADVTLATSSIRRNETSPQSRLKTLAYFDNIQATQEADAKGAQDALLLNTKDKVACSTIANIFMVKDQALITPPPSDGILNGIARSKIMERAPKLGLTIREESLPLEQIKKADGLFLTNSLRIIRRVTRLDDITFPQSEGDTISQCQKMMQDHFIEGNFKLP